MTTCGLEVTNLDHVDVPCDKNDKCGIIDSEVIINFADDKKTCDHLHISWIWLSIYNSDAPSERKKLDSQERVGEHGFRPKQTEQNLFPLDM